MSESPTSNRGTLNCHGLDFRNLYFHHKPMSSTTQRVSFASLTPNNLGTVRKLNSVLFPVKYSEKFYQDILLPEVEDYCKLGSFDFTSLFLLPHFLVTAF
jgi:hypothetical protein